MINYLSGVLCRLSACGAADAIATQQSLLYLKSRMTCLCNACLPRLPWKKVFKWVYLSGVLSVFFYFYASQWGH